MPPRKVPKQPSRPVVKKAAQDLANPKSSAELKTLAGDIVSREGTKKAPKKKGS